MDGAILIALILAGLAGVLWLGGVLTERRRKPMARYVSTDILPDPDPRCVRVAFREDCQ